MLLHTHTLLLSIVPEFIISIHVHMAQMRKCMKKNVWLLNKEILAKIQWIITRVMSP